jgi:hypothetical protein
MANPTNSSSPHWFLYSLQFKNPSLERAQACGISNPSDSVLEVHSYDIPRIFKNDTVRKIAAVLVWLVGLGVFTALGLFLSGAIKKTNNYKIEQTAKIQHDIAKSNVNIQAILDSREPRPQD